MAHDVFISYASQDKHVADATCAKLEAGRIRCWIAPRDILPGKDYGESIIEAINQCRICVLIFSAHANNSDHVKNEVERVISKGNPIIPFRVDEVTPSGSLALHLSRRHWLDALTPPLEKHLDKLSKVVQNFLNSMKEDQPGIKTGIYEPADNSSGTGGKERTHEDKKVQNRSNRKVVIAGIVLIAIAVFAIVLFNWNGNNDRITTTHIIKKVKPDEVKEESGKRIDALVASLAAKYKEDKVETSGIVSDEWTSRPLTMVLMDIQSTGTSEADKEKFIGLFTMSLQNEDRINMVEREILLKLLEELELSSSALADPLTSLKIGKVFSAQVIVTGKMISQGREETAILRFIDTETTAIKKVISAEYSSGDMPTAIDKLKTDIITWAKTDFPIRGRIVSLSGDKCQVNIGQIHGLKRGDRLEILNEFPEGSGIYSIAGEVEINEMGKDRSMGIIAGSSDSIQKDNKVRWRQ